MKACENKMKRVEKAACALTLATQEGVSDALLRILEANVSEAIRELEGASPDNAIRLGNEQAQAMRVA